jgi:hypothetical protein
VNIPDVNRRKGEMVESELESELYVTFWDRHVQHELQIQQAGADYDGMVG